MRKCFINQKGQTLIEVLVSLAVVGVIVSAVAILSIYSLHNTESNKNRSLATQYAQEGIETVRKIRDSDYFGSYKSKIGTTSQQVLSYCYSTEIPLATSFDNSPWGMGFTYCPNPIQVNGINTIFMRQIDLTKDGCGASGLGLDKVVSTVYWSDSKCTLSASPTIPPCNNVQLSTCLTSIYVAPTPQ